MSSSFILVFAVIAFLLCSSIVVPPSSADPDVSGFVDETQLLDSFEEAAVQSCCGRKFRSCCAEAVNYNRPLSCPSNKMATWRMVDCIHRHLFASDRSNATSKEAEEESSKIMPLRNIVCCSVFAENRNDPRNVCQDQCLSTMLSPSLDAADKMFRVQKCRRRNLLFSCFKKCVEHNTADDSPPFDFDAECSWEMRLKPGDVYVGAEI